MFVLMVGLSICPSAGNDRKLWENSIKMLFGVMGWVCPKNDVLDGTQIPHGKGSFLGRNGVLQCNVEWENVAQSVQND